MDIYFIKEWGKVNQYIEPGEPREFVLSTENGIVRNQYILREIPFVYKRKKFYDITSPYGYGGPYIEECKDGYKDILLQQYMDSFEKYCRENDIVSEFIRFHPIVGNAKDFRKIYAAECIRHTVGTDLTGDGDPVQLEFSKSCRKNIKRAIKAGVTWNVTERPTDIQGFVDVYYSTMDRNEAGEFYYFPKEYFDTCMELFGDHILLVQAIYEEKTIAAGFYITYGDVIHAHLSGTLSEYLYLSPAYIIKYATARWGKEHGYKLIHYGGGTSNDPENSLYQFKLKFTKDTIFDFYVGRKIWNPEIYEGLVALTGKYDAEYFPKYRG